MTNRIEVNAQTGEVKVINYTPAEEAEHTVKVAAADKAAKAQAARDLVLAAINALELPTGFNRRQREFVLANSADAGVKAALAVVDAAVAKLRVTLI